MPPSKVALIMASDLDCSVETPGLPRHRPNLRRLRRAKISRPDWDSHFRGTSLESMLNQFHIDLKFWECRGVSWLSKTVLFFIVLLITNLANAGSKALVIVDMQDYFVARGGTKDRGDNPKILSDIFGNQKKMIDAAKRNHLPILLVEYASFGATNQELLEYIGEYSPVITVMKSTDGLFDSRNVSVQAARDVLASWSATDLIVMGANGGACVERTIRGALHAGYKVWAYEQGIADFNYDSYRYPYNYDDRDDIKDLRAEGLKEVEKAKQVVDFRRRRPEAGN
jgi:nicotinamidase-related amidase